VNDHLFDTGTRTGTACGALLAFVSAITANSFIEASLLAATGAVISFVVSRLLKRIFGKRK
jgi:mannitol-specific phosphotransferase system IIBC component